MVKYFHKVREGHQWRRKEKQDIARKSCNLVNPVAYTYALNIGVSLNAAEKGFQCKNVQQRGKRAPLSGPIGDEEGARQVDINSNSSSGVDI